jgi:hypothetical protein
MQFFVSLQLVTSLICTGTFDSIRYIEIASLVAAAMLMLSSNIKRMRTQGVTTISSNSNKYLLRKATSL